MAAIIPALLPRSREDLVEKLSRLHGLVTEVQIDSVDDLFTETPSWPYESPASAEAFNELPGDEFSVLHDFTCEADLMVRAPETALASWLRLGASRVVVHVESTPYLSQTIAHFQKTYGHEKGFAPGLISFGLAISVDTELSVLEPFLDTCDFVQFMGIARIGRQGEPFDTRVLRKIAAFRRLHPDVEVQVDGGVSLQTLPKLLDAGVRRCIVGSGLWNASNIAERLRELQDIVDAHLYT